MTGTTDRLREEFARLADEAAPADLHSRVLRTSRRLRVRRVATTVTAVAAAIALAGAGVANLDEFTAAHRPPRPLDQAPTPTPTSTPKQPYEAEGQGPPPERPELAQPVTPLTPGPSVGRAPKLTLYTLHGGDGKPLRLESRRLDGTGATILRSWPMMDVHGLEMSPDGRWVAWIRDRTLTVSRLDGTAERLVHGDLFDDENDRCFLPVWSADSRRILIRRSDGQIGYVDVASGAFRPLAGTTGGCGFRVSADGRWLAWRVRATGQVMVDRTDGTQHRAVIVDGRADLQRIDYLEAISPDGKLVSVMGSVTGSSRSARRIVDVASGATARYTEQPVDQSLFLRDGRLLLCLNTGEFMLVNPGARTLLWRGTVAGTELGGVVDLR